MGEVAGARAPDGRRGFLGLEARVLDLVHGVAAVARVERRETGVACTRAGASGRAGGENLCCVIAEEELDIEMLGEHGVVERTPSQSVTLMDLDASFQQIPDNSYMAVRSS